MRVARHAGRAALMVAAVGVVVALASAGWALGGVVGALLAVSVLAALWAVLAVARRLQGRKAGARGVTAPAAPLPKPPPAGSASAIGRRQALRLFGFAAAGMVPVPLLRDGMHVLVRRAEAAEQEPATDGAVVHRLRRWTMIIDLRRCDGCQSINLPPQCTMACIESHFAPRPMEWIEVYEEPVSGPDADGTQFRPVPCQHCENPPCVKVCPVGATFSTPEGVVLIDQERCIGCRVCMAACPYDRRFFNWGNPGIPPEALLAEYSPEHQVPAEKGTVMKCDFCPDVARSGHLPYCVQACPHGAIYYGDMEEGFATNGRQVVDVHHYLAEQGATRLKEDFGTQPRVYYIPGHGEDVGREASKPGRLPMVWPWKPVEGASSWQR